jgi:hypothetical protein
MKTTLLSLCVAAFVMSAAACHKNPARPAEGPMERAGKKVDATASDAKDDTKAAGKKAGQDAKDAKETVKRKVD